jgi:hypothetical protein
MIFYPGCGVDRETGQIISGWPHLKQSLGVIFTTSFGERVMIEWFGSGVPYLLGENMVSSTFLAYFSAICAAISLWEPRFKVTQIAPVSIDRLGRAVFSIQGEYMPRGHLGDFTVADLRKIRTFGAPQSLWHVEDQ